MKRLIALGALIAQDSLGLTVEQELVDKISGRFLR